MTEERWHKGRLLEISGAYWQTCTLHAAVKLGIFSVLARQEQTADAVAGLIGAPPRSTAMLLNALVAMGLIKKSGQSYANTPFSAEYLDAQSPHYLGYIIQHHHHLVDVWAQLDTAVTTGQPVRGRLSSQSDTWRENFLMGMFNLASNIAPEIARNIDLAGKKRLLDLGGGPGTYAIYFCLENPHLRATVFDLPTTQPFALKTIKQFGLEDKITFAAGDYLNSDPEGNYDVVWISHILHAENPEHCHLILKKGAAVLEPGGMLIIHDFILNNQLDGPLFPSLFSLNMLLCTQDGQAYSERQIKEMAKKVGIRKVRRIPIDTPNDSGILIGIK